MRFWCLSLCFAVLLAVVAPLTASAQNNFDPSRIPEQFALPPVREEAPPMPKVPAPAVSNYDPNTPHFVVSQIQITGMTVLDDAAVAALIDTYIGRNVSLQDMQELANKLTQLYRDNGYVLSQIIIPPQRIENGIIQMAALEGRITKVSFTGDDDLWIKASAVGLTAEQPLRINTLQRWLLLANDAPGLTVTGNLTPDPETPLGSELVINIARESTSVIAGFDNRGSKFIGPWQIYSGLQWNGALQRGDTLALRGYTSHPDGQLKYVQIQQSMPLGTDGMRIEATADIVRSKPGDSLKALEAEGKTDAFKLALTYPVIRSLVQNLVVGVTAEISNTRTSILDDQDLPPSVSDRTRVLSGIANYNHQHDSGATSSVQLTLSRGLDVLDSSQGNALNPSRAGAEPEFRRAIVEADHRIPLTFIKPGSSLLFGTMAQTSFGDSLLASEQLAAGGNAFGRGFDPAIISGDQGLMGKAELSVPVDFDYEMYIRNAEVYSFADAAYVRDVHTASGIEPHRQLMSAGLGFRLQPHKNVSMYVEGAKQLPMSITSSGERPHGFRATLGVIARF